MNSAASPTDYISLKDRSVGIGLDWLTVAIIIVLIIAVIVLAILWVSSRRGTGGQEGKSGLGTGSQPQENT